MPANDGVQRSGGTNMPGGATSPGGKGKVANAPSKSISPGVPTMAPPPTGNTNHGIKPGKFTGRPDGG